jgi:hypothetical protein
MTRTPDALNDFIKAELDQKVMPEARILVEKVVGEMGGNVLAVLFYGSCLRTKDGSALMDFYVLIDGAKGYAKGAISRFAHRLMPPFVRYVKHEDQGRLIHAKVSVITLSRFEALAQQKALDISIWARFAQPTALVYAANKAARNRVEGALRNAIITAMNWAVCFGPSEGSASAYWKALFRKTYAAELRIEDQSRADLIVDMAADRYDALFLPALGAAGFTPEETGSGVFQVNMEAAKRRGLKRKWLACRIASKTSNFLRILKGAFTFEGRADYVAWKIERRTGVALELTNWQRAHPVLSLPKILVQLWQKGAFSKPR